MTKSGQGQIDLGGFLQASASGTSLGLTLRTGQIDNVKLADLDMSFTVSINFTRLDSDGEDGMGTRGVFIHVSGTDMSVHVTLDEDFHHIGRGLDHEG